MVIHNDSEAPDEISFIMKPITMESSLEVSNAVLKRKRYKKNKDKTNSCSSATETDSEENVPSVSEISAEDLNELKTVYQQCKDVMRKIETKYGHLMSLDTSESAVSCSGPRKKRRKITEEHILQGDTECQCTLNKKIVFDEEGKEVVIDALPSNHICAKKLISYGNLATVPHIETRNVQIEYHNDDMELTDDVQELRNILRNPDIATTHRNLVINKLKSMKLEYFNEVKFNKHSLIEKVKSNPDEVFIFKGSNLSVITGYL